jgi:predicted outer membrane repeat protein
MTRVTFEQNEAAFGGGFSAAPNADISLTDSLLADNVASARGGGVYAEAEGPSVLTLVDTDVRGGSAASGGGLYGSDLTLVCTGAIDLDAGVHDNEAQQVYLTGAKWQFDADACDLGLSDAQGEVFVEGAGSWVYGEDATFHCDPTGCR